MRRDRGPAWKKRIVGHGEEPPDQLLANPANWRTHPDSQADQLAAVMEQVGWIQDVIVNRRTGHVIDGHLRISIALRRNEETVPVTYVELSPAEERLALATYDPLAAMAGVDTEKITELKEDVHKELPEECDIDLETIHAKTRRESVKGLAHEVKKCTCCEKKCKPGCGCYRE